MLDQITVRTARTHEISMLLGIMSDAYGARGYCSHRRAEQYLERNQFALVAAKDEEIVGTMLVTYDEGVLPIDEDFPEEIRQIRCTAALIAHYGQVAVKTGGWKIGLDAIAFALHREAMLRAVEDRIEVVVTSVEPRHVRRYRAMGFTAIERNRVGDFDAPTDRSPVLMIAKYISFLAMANPSEFDIRSADRVIPATTIGFQQQAHQQRAA